MSDWKTNLYLSFERERTQPSIDLMTRINLDKPYRIIDIGCGPGNSTNILKLRWPEAELIGLDDSEAMIQQAKEKYKDIKWVLADATGDLSSLGTFDIVFPNAAIQWMPNHPALIKNMFKLLNKGGVLAVRSHIQRKCPSILTCKS